MEISARRREVDKILYSEVLVGQNDQKDLLGYTLYRSHFRKKESQFERMIIDIRAENLPNSRNKIKTNGQIRQKFPARKKI
jgi:hypothetical protein